MKNTLYKWLNLRAFLEASFPEDEIVTIRYFTARIRAREPDLNQAVRQNTYLRALSTLPNLIIHERQFQSRRVWMQLDPPPIGNRVEIKLPDGIAGAFGEAGEEDQGLKISTPLEDLSSTGRMLVRVRKDEEKGSDVNLATYLLRDALQNECEAAVLVSNDSDLVEPVRILRQEFYRKTLVLFPTEGGPSRALLRAIGQDRGGFRPLRVDPSLLMAHQFPKLLTDLHGTITKPDSW